MNFEDLLPEVLPNVNGCPSFTATDHIRRAAREFCRRTHVWQAQLAPFDTVANTDGYALTLPTASSVVRLFRVDVGDESGVDLTDEEDALARVAAGEQGAFAWLSGSQLKINPVPSSVVPVTVLVSLKPTAAAETWPDDLAENHREALIAGALSTLFLMPKTDWSDNTLAAANTNLFEVKVSRSARNRSKGRATQRRRGKNFF